MSRQYKRLYRLSITPEDGLARVVTDLRTTFEITKSILSYPNKAKIIIYNPSPDTLSSLQKKFTKISLDAGYEGGLRLIFKGQIRNVFQSKIGTDRLITVYAGDGEQDWQNSSFNKTFSQNVAMSSVIKEVMESFKDTTLGILEGLPEVADKLMGQTLSGSSKAILDEFAEEYGFDWSIQDGEIVTTPIDEPLSNLEAVVVNSGSGMVGSPTITEIGADVSTLLNPRLLPNTAFKIESVNADIAIGNLFFRNIPKTSAEGIYKIQEVLFKGDSREGLWLSSVKGRKLNA